MKPPFWSAETSIDDANSLQTLEELEAVGSSYVGHSYVLPAPVCSWNSGLKIGTRSLGLRRCGLRL